MRLTSRNKSEAQPERPTGIRLLTIDVNALSETARNECETQNETHRREALAYLEKTVHKPRGSFLAVPSSEAGYVPAGPGGLVHPDESQKPRAF